MILSASRRTDIPNYYPEWFIKHLKEGFFYVRNPVNTHQISKINVSEETLDGIVFWTKNPENMMKYLNELERYSYYFQFTLTGYGQDIEPGLPDKRTVLLPLFKKLSQKVGRERVIWRYDPILFQSRYNFEYHVKTFSEIAENLKGYTNRVVISFLDKYAKIKKNMDELEVREPGHSVLFALAEKFSEIAEKNQMFIESCAEEMDLEHIGIRHGRCIDKELIEQISGYRLGGKKDKNQREECGCMESIDIGTYNTCKNGCKYCYASFSRKRIQETIRLYDISSPLLCGKIESGDKITERKIKKLRID